MAKSYRESTSSRSNKASESYESPFTLETKHQRTNSIRSLIINIEGEEITKNFPLTPNSENNFQSLRKIHLPEQRESHKSRNTIISQRSGPTTLFRKTQGHKQRRNFNPPAFIISNIKTNLEKEPSKIDSPKFNANEKASPIKKTEKETKKTNDTEKSTIQNEKEEDLGREEENICNEYCVREVNHEICTKTQDSMKRSSSTKLYTMSSLTIKTSNEEEKKPQTDPCEKNFSFSPPLKKDRSRVKRIRQMTVGSFIPKEPKPLPNVQELREKFRKEFALPLQKKKSTPLEEKKAQMKRALLYIREKATNRKEEFTNLQTSTSPTEHSKSKEKKPEVRSESPLSFKGSPRRKASSDLKLITYLPVIPEVKESITKETPKQNTQKPKPFFNILKLNGEIKSRNQETRRKGNHFNINLAPWAKQGQNEEKDNPKTPNESISLENSAVETPTDSKCNEELLTKAEEEPYSEMAEIAPSPLLHRNLQEETTAEPIQKRKDIIMRIPKLKIGTKLSTFAQTQVSQINTRSQSPPKTQLSPRITATLKNTNQQYLSPTYTLSLKKVKSAQHKDNQKHQHKHNNNYKTNKSHRNYDNNANNWNNENIKQKGAPCRKISALAQKIIAISEDIITHDHVSPLLPSSSSPNPESSVHADGTATERSHPNSPLLAYRSDEEASRRRQIQIISERESEVRRHSDTNKPKYLQKNELLKLHPCKQDSQSPDIMREQKSPLKESDDSIETRLKCISQHIQRMSQPNMLSSFNPSKSARHKRVKIKHVIPARHNSSKQDK